MSVTNGMVSAANFSPDGAGEGDGGGSGAAVVAATAGVEVGVDAEVVRGDGIDVTWLLAAAASFSSLRNSNFVKYRNPPTPMATRHTIVTASGHIQFGLAAGGGESGFLVCGVA